MAAAAIVNIWNRKILLAASQGPEGWHASSFQFSSKLVNPLWRYCIFSIFQDSGCRHLGFSNSQNFIGWRCLEGPDVSLYKFRKKWVVPLQRYCNFSNFQYFGFFQIATFYWLMGPRGSRCMRMPNFVKIGQLVAKILRFLNFSRWRPSAILD